MSLRFDFDKGTLKEDLARRVWDATLSKYDGTSGANEWVWDYFLG